MTAMLAIRLAGLLVTLAVQPMPPANPVPQPQLDPAYEPQAHCPPGVHP